MEILGVLKSGPNACDEDLRLSLETLVALSDQVLVEPTLLERAHVLLPRESLAADREISPAWIIELQSGESIDPKDWALTREAMEDFEVDPGVGALSFETGKRHLDRVYKPQRTNSGRSAASGARLYSRSLPLPRRRGSLWQWLRSKSRTHARLGLWRRNQRAEQETAAPKASLILATYEMPKHLSRVFAGLELQTTQDFEVIVCDDGSGEETRRVIEHYRERAGVRVEHIWQENKGFRKSLLLNKGVRASRGEILVFLDGDCVPHPDFMLDHIENSEPGRYLAGRRIELGEEYSKAITALQVRNSGLIAPHWRLLRSVLDKDSEFFQRTLRVKWKPLRNLMKMEKVDDLKGCNYSVFRDDFYKINGYDEAYEGYGREDGDIEVRLQNLGLKIKSLKGLALQGHIWHPRRAFTPKNDQLWEEAEMRQRIRADRGIENPPTGSA
jgi:glycosyltransferase involved in cell wall biosynthesis